MSATVLIVTLAIGLQVLCVIFAYGHLRYGVRPAELAALRNVADVAAAIDDQFEYGVRHGIALATFSGELIARHETVDDLLRLHDFLNDLQRAREGA